MNNTNRRFIFFICLVSAMGGLLFGYDWVVIGGAKPFYEVYFGIQDSPSNQGLAMSVALLGCMAGAPVQGWLADCLGRKPLLVISAVLFLVSAVMTGAACGFTLFLTARLVGGVGIGVASGLSPMYIAEISPAGVRGRLVSLNQMTIVIGILAAQITNMLIAGDVKVSSAAGILGSWYGRMAWRWMFWAEAVPAAAFLSMAFFIPESPAWQLLKGRTEKARRTYARIGGEDYARAEILSHTGKREAANPDSGGRAAPESGRFRLSRQLPAGLLFLGVFAAVFQQWCGTNVIFNYAQEIFQAAGYGISDMLFNIVVTGVTNVVFTVVAIFTVDLLGRRRLMIFGAGGLCLIYGVMGFCYYTHVTGVLMICLAVAAISCYAVTLGPCTWVLVSELFPARVRSLAVAVCTLALWAGSTTLTYTFPLLNGALGSWGTFWIYSAVCLVGLLVFVFRLPETGGRRLE